MQRNQLLCDGCRYHIEGSNCNLLGSSIKQARKVGCACGPHALYYRTREDAIWCSLPFYVVWRDKLIAWLEGNLKVGPDAEESKAKRVNTSQN